MEKGVYFFRDVKDIGELQKKTKNASNNIYKKQKFKIVIEKELSKNDFIKFQDDFIRTWEFIKNNTYKLTMNNNAEYLCMLVKTPTEEYGILVNSAGYTYARNVAIMRLGG